MEPVGSWYGYSRVGEEGGSQLLPLAPPPGAFPPPPPPVYDLAPLFTQKAPHYGGLRKPTEDPPPREQYHPQPPTSGFFDQTGNTAWSQGGQLPSPFGILPHESVVPDSPKTYDNFNHFAQTLSSFADPKKRTQSPPVKTPTPTAFFQQPFSDNDVSYTTMGGGGKGVFTNGGVPPQPSCVVTTSTGINKDYRIPQPPPRTQYNKPRNFTPQVAPSAGIKPPGIGRDRHNETESQSSPISFAMMDAQRGFKPRPQFPPPPVQQNFRFTPPEVRSENYNNGECARRPQHSGSPIYPPMYSSPPQHEPCFNKQSNEPPPLDVTLPRTPVAAYSSVITRTVEKNFVENRFSQGQWGEIGRGDQNGTERQQYYENNHHQNLQDLSSCRGDPMSLVKTLQQDGNTKTDDKLKKRRKSVDKPPTHHQDEYYPRVPPPAHHNQPGQNGYLDFERWNLPPPPPPPGKVFPTSPVTFGSQPSANFVSNHQAPPPLMVPAPPLSYFPPFHLTQPTQPPDTTTAPTINKPNESNKPKVVVPDIEEELSFLAEMDIDIEVPTKPLAPNPNAGFMSSFIKFLQGEKEPSPPPATQHRHRSQPPPPPIPPAPQPKEFPGDPQDDPRYFPLPKSSDSRVFDSSEDSDYSDDAGAGIRVKKKHEPQPLSVASSPTAERVTANTTKSGTKQVQKPKFSVFKPKKKKPIQEDPIEPVLPPRRQTSKRKAKEKPLPKEEGGEEEVIPELQDSDSDPAWMPQPQEDDYLEEKKHKKSKKLSASRRRRKSRTMEMADDSDEDDTPLLVRVSRMENTLIKSVKHQSTTKNNKNKGKALFQKTVENKQSDTIEVNKCPFKNNSFILLKSDFHKWNPPLWRVKSKGMLQKFNSFVKNGVVLYVSNSNFRSWNTKNDMKEAKEVEVKVLGHNKTETVVQPLSYLLLQEPPLSDLASIENNLRETSKYQDNFEVFIQTLFSQALDSNFLMEIFQEKDEYFLSNVRAIDTVTASYADRLCKAMGWSGEEGLQATLSKKPSLKRESGGSDMLCEGCSREPASIHLNLSGAPYYIETLRPKPLTTNTCSRYLLKVCAVCCERAELLHRLFHQKCALFAVCVEAVRIKRENCPAEDTTAILNMLLADEPWTNQLFKEVRITWALMEIMTKDQQEGSH